MKLTLGQVQDTLGLSRDTYRHWTKVLLPLASRKGRKARFSHGDLLALAIIKSLTDQIGASIGNLNSLARELFEQCGQQPWTRFERLAAVITPADRGLSFSPEGQIP